MSSRRPGEVEPSLVLGVALVAALTGCQREKRDYRGDPLPETAPTAVVGELYPGRMRPAPADPRTKSYENNAYHVSQGSRLFRWYNCNGCHANGGGGMGPALIDAEWRYGGSMEQIYATIAQGRPNGMPSFGSKIPQQQIWELAAYVRSLSGNTSSNANFTRRDAMTSVPPRSQAAKEKTGAADPAGGSPS